MKSYNPERWFVISKCDWKLELHNGGSIARGLVWRQLLLRFDCWKSLQNIHVPSCIHGVKCGPQSAVLLPVKSDFPNHDGVGAGMVRDGLRVVARDHTSHGLGGPRMNAQGVDVIPVRIWHQEHQIKSSVGKVQRDHRSWIVHICSTRVCWLCLPFCMVSFSEWVAASYSETQVELHKELTGTGKSWDTWDTWVMLRCSAGLSYPTASLFCVLRLQSVSRFGGYQDMDVLWADPSNHCIQDLLATPRQLSHPAVLHLVPRFTDPIIHVLLF